MDTRLSRRQPGADFPPPGAEPITRAAASRAAPQPVVGMGFGSWRFSIGGYRLYQAEMQKRAQASAAQSSQAARRAVMVVASDVPYRRYTGRAIRVGDGDGVPNSRGETTAGRSAYEGTVSRRSICTCKVTCWRKSTLVHTRCSWPKPKAQMARDQAQLKMLK